MFQPKAILLIAWYYLNEVRKFLKTALSGIDF